MRLSATSATKRSRKQKAESIRTSGVVHALLLARLQPDQQEKELSECFRKEWAGTGKKFAAKDKARKAVKPTPPKPQAKKAA
jgi:hypothetical protein